MYVADVDEIRPQYSMDAPDANALFASAIVRTNVEQVEQGVTVELYPDQAAGDAALVG